MSYDLNDAGPQMAPSGELIPDGTFARLRMTIRPGGSNGAVPMDSGLIKLSQSSDAKMLDCEFSVVDGPYARRKLWQSFTVAGGKLDEKGQSKGWNISKATFRAMIDSALGLNPKDESPEAKSKRVLQGLKQLDGISFVARIMIESSDNPRYRDQNRIANVVTPDEPQYTAVMEGRPVPPDPVKAPPRKTGAAAAVPPAWGSAPSGPAQTPAWSGAPAAPAQAPSWSAAPKPPAPQQPQPQPAAPTTAPAWLNG